LGSDLSKVPCSDSFCSFFSEVSGEILSKGQIIYEKLERFPDSWV
jgi:hypothetical protein